VKLGRYEIVRELGKGAMGVVYLAKDPLIGRLVALKTIRATRGDDDETKEFQQRFVREAQAAGILNHPAIVTVHDIGQDDTTGVSFIAMEYVEGQNLKEILAQGRPLTFEEIGEIIAQVADALDFAHSKGIVHRDVKPANVILVEGNRAKIMDFGIAKIATGGNLTSTGQFLGTPNYMAPEQIKGAPVDGRTDIFSLGICLYECLTRRKPFGGDSLTAISYKIVHEPFPPLHEINPQIPDGFEDVVALCLAKDPAKRYQRGRDMATALRAVVRGERPVQPHEPMLEEATMITRDDGRIPTVEIPFPQASAAGAILKGNPRGTIAAAPAAPPVIPIARPAPGPRPRPSELMRKTLDGVRAMPLWRSVISPVIFFIVIGIFLLALVIVVASIRSRNSTIPTVDTASEAKVARQKLLRTQAERLLVQGKVEDAYAKLEQLAKLAPGSSFVAGLLAKLSAVRQQEAAGRQQIALAQQRFDEGLAFYNNKQYPEAIKALEESFHLNPNSDDTANYLKLAQQEQEREQGASAQAAKPVFRNAQTSTQPAIATRGRQTKGAAVKADAPAHFTTLFDSPAISDGYIMVKFGGEVVAYEQLWQETGRFITRRKVPRAINVGKDVVPKNAELEVWVVVQSMGIQEHHTFRQNLAPGSAHRLTVTFDSQSKKFDYQLN
jgi:serine/threonine protein kinase